MSGRIAIDRVSTATFLRALYGYRGTPASLLAGITTFLASVPGRVFSSKEIAAHLYGDDPDGGALWSEKCIANAVCRLRRSGIPIATHHSRGYSLERSS